MSASASRRLFFRPRRRHGYSLATTPSGGRGLPPFNRWLRRRGFATISALRRAVHDLWALDSAVDGCQWFLERVARDRMSAAPVRGRARAARPPTLFRPFLGACDIRVTVAFHAATGYGRYFRTGARRRRRVLQGSAWRSWSRATARPSSEMAALVCHGLFHRFPRTRLLDRMGSNWVTWLIQLQARIRHRPKEFPAATPVDPLPPPRLDLSVPRDDVNCEMRCSAPTACCGSTAPTPGLSDPTDTSAISLPSRRPSRSFVMHDNAQLLSRAAYRVRHQGPRRPLPAPAQESGYAPTHDRSPRRNRLRPPARPLC